MSISPFRFNPHALYSSKQATYLLQRIDMIDIEPVGSRIRIPIIGPLTWWPHAHGPRKVPLSQSNIKPITSTPAKHNLTRLRPDLLETPIRHQIVKFSSKRRKIKL